MICFLWILLGIMFGTGLGILSLCSVMITILKVRKCNYCQKIREGKNHCHVCGRKLNLGKFNQRLRKIIEDL